jgi:AGZA family xanthine/uracil permease-like MFS transporter
MLERIFQLKANHTTVRTEMLAGLTTFLTMSYIIFINPTILSQAGMDKGAVFVATCIAAAFGSSLMGLLANYPIALAPGMALNTYFTYSIVQKSGYDWQTALGAVFISGLLFLCISIFPFRNYLINSIPKSLKVAIVAGMGLFLGVIGFKSAGIIISNPTTLMTLGNLHEPSTLLAILGFFIIIALDALEITASVIISILSITFLSIILGYNQFHGLFSMPPSLMPTFMQMNIENALSMGLTTIVFAILFVDLFDNTGTLIGVAYRAGFINEHGELPRIGRALFAGSLAAMASALFGTSTTTSYLESTVGVKVGGKTGLMAMVVAILFLASLFLSPLAESIPIYATAPALVYVASLMTQAFADINWKDSTEYAPAVITAITMPLTFSIADGISFGFITYTVVKLLSGRFRDLNAATVILTIAFLLKLIFFTH